MGRRLAVSEGKSERRGLLWWIEHENTNEFWSARNPWLVIAVAATAIIVLCMVAMHFWGLPREVADVTVNIVFYGYLAALFFCEVKTGRRVAALGVAAIAAFNLLLWEM